MPDMQKHRTGATKGAGVAERIQTMGRREAVLPMVGAVSADIKSALGNDPRLRLVNKAGLEFLLSMGLLVNDPSDRCRVLVESMHWAVTWRK